MVVRAETGIYEFTRRETGFLRNSIPLFLPPLNGQITQLFLFLNFALGSLIIDRIRPAHGKVSFYRKDQFKNDYEILKSIYSLS